MADQVLKFGVAGISDLVAIPGLINLDLADVRRVMTKADICHMGIGRSSGEGRATDAVKQAINSPLLDTTIEGANGVIVNFTGGRNMKLQEIDMAAKLVRESVAPEAEIIVGAVVDASLEDEIMITVIASGFDNSINASAGHRANTSTISRGNPQIISDNRAPVQPATSGRGYGSRMQQPAQPQSNAAPGFLFGDESVSTIQQTRPEQPAPAPQPVQQAPVQPIAPQARPQQSAPAPRQAAPAPQQYAPQQPAPAPAPAPVQQGGRPQVNVAPQPSGASSAPKSAKPWFMFGRDSE